MKRGNALWRTVVGLTAGLALTAAAACGSDDGGTNGNGSGSGKKSEEKESPSPEEEPAAEDPKDQSLNFALVGWGEDIAVTELWNQVLQSEGYAGIESDTLDPGVIFAGLSEGDVDAFVDYWLPVTHADYKDEFGDQFEDLGTWNESAALTFAVPTYVDDSVQSIADLADNAEMFDSKVVGIEPGSGLAGATDEAVFPTYGLEEAGFDHVTSSTSAMLAELDSAVSEEKPIVVTLWRPHWAYDAWDLRDLEDPEKTLGEVETISVAARDGFSEEYPQLSQWLKDFEMTDDELYSLMFTINDPDGHDGDAEAGVAEWIEANPDFVASMTD